MVPARLSLAAGTARLVRLGLVLVLAAAMALLPSATPAPGFAGMPAPLAKAGTDADAALARPAGIFQSGLPAEPALRALPRSAESWTGLAQFFAAPGLPGDAYQLSPSSRNSHALLCDGPRPHDGRAHPYDARAPPALAA